MFNRKKIETLERRIKNLELTVQRLEGYLGPLESHNSYQNVYANAYIQANNSLNPPEQVTLNDLVMEFRRTHVKVNCSSHWEPKPKA